MCYSKEVSLAAGGVILAVTAWTWRRYVHPRPRVATSGGSDLRGAYAGALLGLGCVGGHQLFEFLAIATGSQAVYKLGLMCSMTCMVFLMHSLERLTGVRYGTRAFVAITAVTGAEMLLRDMQFENCHFWVRGRSHVLWGAVWTALYFYWNVCILHARRSTPSAANRRLLVAYAWAVLGVSFVLSMGYALVAGLASHGVGPVVALWRTLGAERLARGFDNVQDAPSIWCVFAVLQVFLLPPLFRAMDREWDVGVPFADVPPRAFARMKLAGLALVLAVTLYTAYPLACAACTKMVTK